MHDYPRSQVAWSPCYHIVSSRFPPIDLFEAVNHNPADWELLMEVEMATSPRARDELGAIHLVPPEDRRVGPGWSPVMAAFCHINPNGSRFTDGSFGAYYCAFSEATAIAETRHHTERFLRDASQPPTKVQKRVYLSNLEAEMVDLRTEPPTSPLLAPDDWSASQILGRKLREERRHGMVYPSVRYPGGECAAVFRPPALSPTWQGRHLEYVWDGTSISHVYESTLVS